MDQLETQVSDLRYLTQPPASLAPTGRGATSLSPGHSTIASPRSAPPGDNSAQPTPFESRLAPAPAKRKPDDDDAGGKGLRSKRNRYISIACNECKRRKIKCNGETPCMRCGNLNLACLYAPNCCSGSFKESDEFRQMTETIGQLQDQVDSLAQNMTALQQETLRLAPIQGRNPPLPSNDASPSLSSSVPSLQRAELTPLRQASSFRGGPTSIGYTVDVAKNTLHNMGYTDGPDDGGGLPEEAPSMSPPIQPDGAWRRAPDPLRKFDKDEMVRLCRVHEDEVGIMYPVLNIETVIQHARNLSAWLESAKKMWPAQAYGEGEGITDMKSLQLKAVMCCALAVEEHGNSERAIRIFESIQPIAERMLMSGPSDVSNLPFLALVAGYRFLSNDEVLAWRVMGQVARQCLELGLHRLDGLAKIPDEQDRKNALTTFWSAYVLDRRWSFATGLPYVVHDEMIDPKLPYPEERPFLAAMITYSKLGAKIWKLVDYFEPVIIRDLKRDEFEAMDREILQWYDTIPDEIRIDGLNKEEPLAKDQSYTLQRLQIWTRLRLNQMRIWLHTPVLHSASSIHDNMALAQKAVDFAKDTIQYLARLNSTTNLYRRIQVFYHQFLTSAIAALFLASTHAPLQFSEACRREFYMALELVKDMSAKSWVSQRLWRTVRSLKAFAPRLGMQEDDPHSSAAMAMAGLARGHQFDGRRLASPGMASPAITRPESLGPPQQMPPGASPSAPRQQLTEDQNNGLRLQSEMSKIFEGYTVMSGVSASPAAFSGESRPPSTGITYANGVSMAEAHGGLVGTDDVGVYEQFRDMF